jgi:hypothetical protein
MFGRPPFLWPPDVVRRQSVRDLLLLSDGYREYCETIQEGQS